MNTTEKNNKDIIVSVRFTSDEIKKIDKEVEKSIFKSRSQYLRECAFNHITVSFDDKKIKEQTRIISGIGNNINQIAARVNSTCRLFASDIEDLKRGVAELWQQQNYILSNLRSLDQLNTLRIPIRPEKELLLLRLLANQNHQKLSDSLTKQEDLEQEEVQSLPIT